MRNELRGTLIAIGALLLLSALFWADCLFGPNAPLAARFQAEMEPWRSEADLPRPTAQWEPLLWDGVAQFYPWRLFAARELRAGRLALWNPHEFCGYPFAANGQSALFYPPNWLLALLDVRWGMGLLAALHFVLASALTYLFARRIRISTLPAALAGVAFAYGGFMVGWTELPTLANSATWLPGALLGIALIFERNRWGIPILAGSLALSALAGHFQIAAYVWLAALMYAVARALWAGTNRRPWYPASLAGGFVLAALLASAQLLPSGELILNSPRGAGGVSEEGFEFQRARALQAVELPALLRPNLFGNPAHGDYELVRFGIPYAEHCGFVGIVTVLLALVGLAYARTRHYAFFLILSAIALNAAMCGPVARWMYFGIPKLGLAGSFTRMLSVYTFALAMAGAAGLDALTRRVGRRQSNRVPSRLPLGIAVAALAVLLYELLPWAHGYLPKTRRADVYPMTPTIERLMATEGRVLAVTPRATWGMVGTPPALLPPNSATVYGCDSVGGYDSLFPSNYRMFAYAAEGGEPAPLANGNMLLPENWRSALYAIAGLTTVATLPYGEVGRGVDVISLSDSFPRAFVARNWAAWTGTFTAVLNARNIATISRTLTDVSPCVVSRDEPANIALSGVRAQGPDPRLIVTETFYPGWSAYSGGQRREITPVADIFCGVPLGNTDTEMRLVFEPASVQVGVFLTLIGISCLLGLIVFRRHGRLGSY